MKKLILITLAVITCVAIAGPVFADLAVGPGNTTTTTIANASLVPSTGVGMKGKSTDTTYCVTSIHNNAAGQTAGLEFGATSTDAVIKTKSAVGLTSATTAGGAAEACGSSTALPSNFL